uniref:F-box domain-containing protein n=1 Tax=Cyprinus carpio TaxID=7962 RepID=A0A8C1J4A1_CYPCA
MPREIILRNHSYLDPGSLFCISFVNKHFQELSNNNFMWYQFYTRGHRNKKKARREDQIIRDLGVVGVQERLKKYWRNAFFKKIAGVNLGFVSCVSGRSLCITWEITVTDGRGRRSTFEQFHAFFSSMAVFVFWGVVNWPPFNQLTSLELHAVLRVPLDCPAPYRCDKIVKMLYFGQGITLGFWKLFSNPRVLLVCEENVHFVTFVLLALLFGFPCPAAGVSALFDDVDPEYGLHGYTVYIELHNTVRVVMSDMLFPAVLQKRTHHTGPDCCMINLTVWDEAKQPFWCVSSPVVMTKANSEARVEMRLKQMEYKEQYFVVNLVIYIAVAKEDLM